MIGWRRGRMNKPRCALVSVFVLAALGGCVGERDWHAVPQVAPESLSADKTLSTAQINEYAWPQDTWWRSYADPQLNTLMSDALAGSPSLQMAQARLRAGQAPATRASRARL